jgi:hypothetical protein
MGNCLSQKPTTQSNYQEILSSDNQNTVAAPFVQTQSFYNGVPVSPKMKKKVSFHDLTDINPDQSTQ